MTVEEFNQLDAAAAAAMLAACADVDSWVGELVSGRPFTSRDALLDRAAETSRTWTAAEVDGALAHHPRIGERPRVEALGATNAAHSAGEQAGVGNSSAAVQQALAEGNLDYEERFGRVFLIRAAGRTAEEMLAALTERLANDDATEAAMVAGQLREIALLRLEREVVG